jgi:membrane-anchored mycosin MYCP
VRLIALAVVAAALVVAPPASAEDEGTPADCKEIPLEEATHFATAQASLPLVTMAVDQAQKRLKRAHVVPGAGVTVAVIDSGVSPKAVEAGRIDIADTVAAGTLQPNPIYYHGTAIAGLIAGKPRQGGGPVGIAPGARIFDVRVYDQPDGSTAADSTESPITPENLRLGLDAVIAAVESQGIRIVNISLAIPEDPEVRAKIEQLSSMGVVVVAPTGNRSSDELPPGMPPSFASHTSGEDAAPYVHPANYDGVLGVSATPEGSANSDPLNWVMENSMTDVAAPSAGAVSYSLRGESCFLADPATSYAAAEVSGVLALLQSAYDESTDASVRRLLTTADGRPDLPNTLVGAGQVQAMDALTRPMDVDPDTGEDNGAGTVEHEPQLLTVPEEPDDVLASTREHAVWWGVIGGGVLLLALLLRPVLARRRRTVSR